MKCQGLLFITRTAFSKRSMDFVKGLQHSPTILCKQAVQEPHCFKGVMTHKKVGNVLDTHEITRLFHAQAKRLATLAN